MKALYRKYVPYIARSRIAGVRGALERQIHPEIFEMGLAQWHAEQTDDVLSDLALGPDSIAIDVGAYKGGWCSDIVARYRCRTIAAEPVPAYADAVRGRFAHNPAVEVHAIGLGDSNRTEQIALLADASSVQRDSSDTVSIQVRDIAEWLDELGVARVSAMQINCEGSEYEILPRLHDAGWLGRIDNLLIQFHLLGDDPMGRRNDCRAKLQETHQNVFAYPFVWEHWRTA